MKTVVAPRACWQRALPVSALPLSTSSSPFSARPASSPLKVDAVIVRTARHRRALSRSESLLDGLYAGKRTGAALRASAADGPPLCFNHSDASLRGCKRHHHSQPQQATEPCEPVKDLPRQRWPKTGRSAGHQSRINHLACLDRDPPLTAQRDARSCLTITSVVPNSRFNSNISSITLAPVAKSRLPVGSSASKTAGRSVMP